MTKKPTAPTETPSADLDPQPVKVGKYEIPPMTIHTAILLEQIDSPFLREPPIGPNGEKIPVVPTMAEFARTLYVLIHQNDPRTMAIISDPVKFDNSVADLARQITFRELGQITGAVTRIMGRVDKAAKEAGIDSDGSRKNAPGPSA